MWNLLRISMSSGGLEILDSGRGVETGEKKLVLLVLADQLIRGQGLIDILMLIEVEEMS